MTATGTISQRAPNLYRQDLKLFALGKEIAQITEVFDGTRAVGTTSYSPPEESSGAELANERRNADSYEPLNWRTLYKTIEIIGTRKVGDEETYVVRKTPAEGTAVTDYVSTTTFRIVRRDSFAVSSTSDATQPVTEIFGDFRLVEGVLLPFRVVATQTVRGTIVITVTEACANVKLDDSLFRVPEVNATVTAVK
ncbi:MAG: hypothetical protein MSG64_19665 [Pyrinomonadaceae bacterium MAG19_C2-C3]|nr:hypothetical protein [Pyrinomonadaceae bacterium MAG19_C2-C3]